MNPLLLRLNGPAPWFCLDIETAAGRPEDVEAAFRLEWLPDGRWTEETVGRRFKEALAKKRERAALIPTAPLVSIACQTPTELVCFHALRVDPPQRVEGGALVFGFGDALAMLTAFRDHFSASVGPDTILAGHNIAGFDLPRLRLALLRAGLALPAGLVDDDQAVVDTLRLFARKFYGEASAMPSLHEACEIAGLKSHKKLVDGTQVGGLIASGQVDAVMTYNLLDVATESALFLRLTGQT